MVRVSKGFFERAVVASRCGLLALLGVRYGPVPREILRSIEAKVMEAIPRPGCHGGTDASDRGYAE